MYQHYSPIANVISVCKLSFNVLHTIIRFENKIDELNKPSDVPSRGIIINRLRFRNFGNVGRPAEITAGISRQLIYVPQCALFILTAYMVP